MRLSAGIAQGNSDSKVIAEVASRRPSAALASDMMCAAPAVMAFHNRKAMGITRADTSVDRYKTVHHPFAARLFEFDLKLIAFNFGDFAIAEFLVKDA